MFRKRAAFPSASILPTQKYRESFKAAMNKFGRGDVPRRQAIYERGDFRLRNSARSKSQEERSLCSKTSKFIETFPANPTVKIIALWAFLTTTKRYIRQIAKVFNETECRLKIKIMVGGAPINRTCAEKIATDAYAPDDASATQAASSLSKVSF